MSKLAIVLLGLVVGSLAFGQSNLNQRTQDFLMKNPPKWTASDNQADTDNLLDDSFDNRWTSRRSMAPGMWLQMEFSEPIMIESITLDAKQSKNDYPRGYELYLSNDGEAWGRQRHRARGAQKLTLRLSRKRRGS